MLRTLVAIVLIVGGGYLAYDGYQERQGWSYKLLDQIGMAPDDPTIQLIAGIVLAVIGLWLLRR